MKSAFTSWLPGLYPCHFAAHYNDIDDPTNLEGNELWDECDGGAGNFLSNNMPNDFRTTGVAVCLNGDKMKGFALIGRYPECILDPNGVTPTGAACNGAGPREDAVEERTNCPGSRNGIDSDWENAAECPPGTLSPASNSTTSRAAATGAWSTASGPSVTRCCLETVTERRSDRQTRRAIRAILKSRWDRP